MTPYIKELEKKRAAARKNYVLADCGADKEKWLKVSQYYLIEIYKELRSEGATLRNYKR